MILAIPEDTIESFQAWMVEHNYDASTLPMVRQDSNGTQYFVCVLPSENRITQEIAAEWPDFVDNVELNPATEVVADFADYQANPPPLKGGQRVQFTQALSVTGKTNLFQIPSDEP